MRGPRRSYARDGLAGCVEMRRRRDGPMVGVYAATQAGFESDPETPWATVCEDHGTLVCSSTRDEAMGAAAHPRDWCAECEEGRPSVVPTAT